MKNLPGVIVMPDKTVRTTKVLKWLEKNKPNIFSIHYLDPVPADFRDVEKNLKELENTLLGLEPIKEKPVFEGQRPYTHTYRVNVNTVLCAYSQEELDKLKKSWNIN
jgi:hypothetical protein